MEKISAVMQDDLILMVLPLFLLAVLLESAYSAYHRLGWYRQQDFWGSMGPGVVVLAAAVPAGRLHLLLVSPGQS
jgi:hypothetical protein